MYNLVIVMICFDDCVAKLDKITDIYIFNGNNKVLNNNFTHKMSETTYWLIIHLITNCKLLMPFFSTQQ